MAKIFSLRNGTSKDTLESHARKTRLSTWRLEAQPRSIPQAPLRGRERPAVKKVVNHLLAEFIVIAAAAAAVVVPDKVQKSF
ncbi:hypothetical protein CLCR_07830 [Cladophialophora carrionii]|uniref:Uncharacterized protein n=1 Tax=Cladophialophora carrionii TaxID=86049 RepID=A0A1C1CM56_9EURO|nr:hypothetical protein CLCR_07830 [Cladophialophora carrionii]